LASRYVVESAAAAATTRQTSTTLNFQAKNLDIIILHRRRGGRERESKNDNARKVVQKDQGYFKGKTRFFENL
jgi:hypothetical protein